MASPQLQRLSKRLLAIPKAAKDAVRPSLIAAGEELAGTMKQLAETSRDTGDLIESIQVTGPGESTPPYSQPGGSTTAGENQVLVTAGNSEVRYPHLVEYGTVHSQAQPFFWPAFRLKRKKLAQKVKRAVGKSVRETWAK